MTRPIETTPTADYPYRIVMAKRDFVDWVGNQAASIDYPNFKSEVAASRGQRFAHALMDVWSAMHQVEDAAARQRQ